MGSDPPDRAMVKAFREFSADWQAWMMGNDSKLPIVDAVGEMRTLASYGDLEDMVTDGNASYCAPIVL